MENANSANTIKSCYLIQLLAAIYCKMKHMMKRIIRFAYLSGFFHQVVCCLPLCKPPWKNTDIQSPNPREKPTKITVEGIELNKGMKISALNCQMRSEIHNRSRLQGPNWFNKLYQKKKKKKDQIDLSSLNIGPRNGSESMLNNNN